MFPAVPKAIWIADAGSHKIADKPSINFLNYAALTEYSFIAFNSAPLFLLSCSMSKSS